MVDAIGISTGGGSYLQGAAQCDYQSSQVLAVGAAAVQTVAFTKPTTVVTLRSTTNCWFRVGGTAVAHVAGSDYLPANTNWMLKMPQGGLVSVIQDSLAGFLSVTPVLSQ